MALVLCGCQADSPPPQASALHASPSQVDRLVMFKSGTSARQTAIDRSECLQSSQVYNAGPMTYTSPSTNVTVFNACTRARGYHTLKLSDVYTTFGGPELQATLAPRRKEWLKETCLNPALASYFAKTSCAAIDMTPAQIDDGARISPYEKAALLNLRRNQKAQLDENDQILRKIPPRGMKAVDLFKSTYQPQFDKADLDLCNGAITWGTYNKRLVEINRAYVDAVLANLVLNDPQAKKASSRTPS
jgi:hypothetical protein